MSNSSLPANSDTGTAVILTRIDAMERRFDERFAQIDRRADERHAELKAVATDHEERIRVLERGQQRGLVGDGASYAYTTLAALVQFFLMHKGP